MKRQLATLASDAGPNLSGTASAHSGASGTLTAYPQLSGTASAHSGASATLTVQPESDTLEVHDALEVHISVSRADFAASRPTPRVFRLLELVVPRRISEELIGDAIEHMQQMARDAAPPWEFVLITWATVFNVAVTWARWLWRGKG